MLILKICTQQQAFMYVQRVFCLHSAWIQYAICVHPAWIQYGFCMHSAQIQYAFFIQLRAKLLQSLMPSANDSHKPYLRILHHF